METPTWVWVQLYVGEEKVGDIDVIGGPDYPISSIATLTSSAASCAIWRIWIGADPL